MNICVFATHFGGGYGAGYSIKKEVAEFAKSGHHVFVIHHEKNIAAYQQSGVEYYYFNINHLPFINIFILKKEIRSIINKILQKNKINLFYIQSLEFGLQIKNFLGKIPIIYFARSTIRGVEVNKSQEYWLDNLRKKIVNPILIYLEKKCLGFSDLIIVKSLLIKEELEKLYRIKKEKIIIIPGGIDETDFPPLNESEKNEIKTQHNIALNKKIILFSGRIAPVKGLYYLIESLAELTNKNKNLILLIAGKSMRGAYFKVINRLIQIKYLEPYVKFLGYIPQNLMYQYYNISDIVALPSTYEPFGMVAIQAAILKKPLLITEVVGAKDCLKNYPLVKIIQSHSSIAIAKAITELLNLSNKKSNFDLKELYWPSVAVKLLNEFSKLLKNDKQKNYIS